MNDFSEIESIAVIGMSGRFPGAQSVGEFWDIVCKGQDCISHFSEEELLAEGADSELVKDDAWVGSRGVLDGIDQFEPEFFGITSGEARIIDPQHRIFLECAWEAFEDAGYDVDKMDGSVGVFAGSSLNTYLLRHVFSNPQATADFIRGFQAEGYPVLIGNDKDYLTTRVAHKLNLRGPAMSIQTACSTSLVAVVQACQSLLGYQCDAALAGGVSISFPQKRGYVYQEGAIASADGRCRAFDENATGTVFGSGCGVVLLKRYSEAQADGDAIYAIIKGAAVNNDGADKVSFSAPSVDGQAEVIALTHALAGISADTIEYVETHGTGTPLGDPIEVAALTKAFRNTTDRADYCALASVKSNVGHLEAAAGVTGLIKACLALHHRRIPPSLYYEKPNPNIDFEQSPFFVNTKLMDWPEKPHPRRAGVSSLGMGGTNAHVVLEESIKTNGLAEDPAPQLLTLSARTPASLKSACLRLAKWIEVRFDPESAADVPRMADVAYTLQTGRRAFRYRHAIASADSHHAIQRLNEYARQENALKECSEDSPQLAFLFPGQGDQRVNMGRQLYETEDLFRTIIDDCCQRLEVLLGLDLRKVLYPSPGDEDRAAEQLNRTEMAQPALFVIGYAMSRLLQSWNIVPAALCGHSIGEFTAAVLADVLSLEDGLSLVAARGRLMQEMVPGIMLATRLSEPEAREYLDESLAIAAVNARKSTVISGPAERIELLQKELENAGIASRILRTSHAFHSQMMKPAAEKFLEEVHAVRFYDAKIKICSTCTGGWINPADWKDPDYWSRQILSPVRFMDAAAAMLQVPSLIFVEIGPGSTLSKLMLQNPEKKPEHQIFTAMIPDEADRCREKLLDTVGGLWCAGITPDWELYTAIRRDSEFHCPPTRLIESVSGWRTNQLSPATQGVLLLRSQKLFPKNFPLIILRRVEPSALHWKKLFQSSWN